MIESPTSIFVVGNSRSGTTLMGRILGKHSTVFTFHELHFFEQLWAAKDFGQILSDEEARHFFAQLIKIQRSGYLSRSSYKPYLNDCPNEVFANRTTGLTREQVFKEFLYHESKINGKKIPCDQTPRNLLYSSEIFRIFQSAKIVVMVRDPRDVLLSQKKKWKRRFLGARNIPFSESLRSWFNYHPATIALLWRQNFRAMQALRQNKAVHVVSFEDLLQNSEAVVKGICSFLHLPFEQTMLDVEFIGSSLAQDKSAKGIVKNSGNWRLGGLSNTEVYLCQQINRQEMKEFGYTIAPVKKNYLLILLSLFFLPIKLSFSVAMNLHRIRNIKESIQKRLNIKMIAQLNKTYIKARPQKIFDRLVSYAFFEGRPMTTAGRWINPLVFSLLHLQKQWDARRPVVKPIFILGTGRSGTTLMGILLSLHRDVAYLNEPKAIWHSVYPHEDIIGNYSDAVGAKYRLGSQHVTRDMIRHINNIYRSYLSLLNRGRVVDKYPEMIFRTEFLKQIYPDAIFIIMARNGYDTASSIETWSKTKGKTHGSDTEDWWGKNDRKWHFLSEQLIANDPDLAPHYEQLMVVRDQRERGIIEWCLSMKEALRIVENSSSAIIVKYEDLAQRPEQTMGIVLKKAMLDEDRTVIKYAKEVVNPPSEVRKFEINRLYSECFYSIMDRLGYSH